MTSQRYVSEIKNLEEKSTLYLGGNTPTLKDTNKGARVSSVGGL